MTSTLEKSLYFFLFLSMNSYAFEFRGYQSGSDISKVVPDLDEYYDKVVEVEKGKVYLAYDLEGEVKTGVSTFLFECNGKLNGGSWVISNNMPLDGYVRWIDLLNDKYGVKTRSFDMVNRNKENKSINVKIEWEDNHDVITLDLESHGKYNPILTLGYYDNSICLKP